MRKLLQIFLAGLLILQLTIIAKNSYAYTENLINNNIPEGLILKEPLVLNEEIVTFSYSEYAVILHLYNAYKLYINTRNDFILMRNNINRQLVLSNERIENKDKLIKVLESERNIIYKIVEDERKKTNKYRTISILVSVAGILALGIAVGLVIE